MWPFPFNVGAGPLRRLHRIFIKGAIISGEVWVGPGLPRVLDKLLNLMHHLAHLVLRSLLLHIHMLILILVIRTVANLLIFRHSVPVVAFLLGLNGDSLLIVVLLLVHAVLHLLHLSHHSWVLHHGLLLHLILLLLLHGQLHLLLFLGAHLLLHELLLVHLVIHVLLHHHLLLLHVHLVHIPWLLLELLLLHLLLLHVLLLHLLLLLLRHLTRSHLLLLRRSLLLLSIVFDLLAIGSLLGGFLLLRGALFRLHLSLLTW